MLSHDIPLSRRGLSRWTPHHIVQEDIEAARQFAESHPEDVRCRLFVDSDVKQGQNLQTEAEARATRLRPVNFWRLRPRLRPKIIMKKYQIMTDNIRFKIVAGKLTKFPNFNHFCPKNARLHNNTTRSRPDRGQMFEAEAEAKILASELNITGTLLGNCCRHTV